MISGLLFLSLLASSSFASLGGVEILPSSEPTVIQFTLLSGGSQNDCTGTYLSKNTILTAAHCLQEGLEQQVKDGYATKKAIPSLKTLEIYEGGDAQPLPIILSSSARFIVNQVLVHGHYKDLHSVKDSSENNHDLAIMITNGEDAPIAPYYPLKANPRSALNSTVRNVGYGNASYTQYIPKGTDSHYNFLSDSSRLRSGTNQLSSVLDSGLLAFTCQPTLLASLGKAILRITAPADRICVLEGDSGGPLFFERSIVGVVRSNEQPYHPTEEWRNYFTSFSGAEEAAFLDDAKSFGAVFSIIH